MKTATPLSQVINWKESARLRTMRAWKRDGFLRGLGSIRGSRTSMHRDKEKFDLLRQEFAAKARATAPEYVKRSSGSEEELRSFIQRPDAVVDYATWRFPSAVRKNWRQGLVCFPDRLALGRWMRLELWYLLKVLRGASEKNWRNDHEDIHYGFLASYCGNLVTADEGLKKACSHVFPTVRVVPSPSDLPARM